jgi:glycosyltransferase involved in cell wall biosynthesis
VEIRFDPQIFRLQSRGGISRCFADLIAGLAAPGLTVNLPFHCHGNAHLQARGLIRLPIEVFQLLRRLGVDDGATLPPASWQASRPAVLHATYYLGEPPQGRSGPLVSTLHDMTPERLPELAPLGRGGRRLHKHAWLAASDAIVSVSGSSAADLIGFAPDLAGRIRVIHHGTSFLGITPRPCRHPGQPFHLLVGRRGGYKNTGALLQALSSLPQALVLVGGGPLHSEERRQLRLSGLENRVHVVHPDDHQLAWLYRHCRAVLIPSFAEGFSLPLIEALACNAPVLASDIPVHREIGETFAVLLDPHDPDAWRQALLASPPRPSERMAGPALDHLHHYFGLDRMLADYRRFYRTLV